MNRPEQLPLEMPKDTIKWLKAYGYSLNSNCEDCKKIKFNLKRWYPYEYYYFVDIDLAQEARKKADLLRKEDFIEKPKRFYTTWDKTFREEKRRLIKELHGLEKKGIR